MYAEASGEGGAPGKRAGPIRTRAAPRRTCLEREFFIDNLPNQLNHRDDFDGLALRHESLEFLFQVE